MLALFQHDLCDKVASALLAGCCFASVESLRVEGLTRLGVLVCGSAVGHALEVPHLVRVGSGRGDVSA